MPPPPPSSSDTSRPSPRELADRVKAVAIDVGFGLCGITAATEPESLAHFDHWLDAGYDGEMRYLRRRRDAYADATRVLPHVRSVVVVALDYRTEQPAPSRPGYGRVSRYAWGASDYHDVLRDKLRALAATLHEAVPGCKTRGVVDTAPVLERDVARRAGLGWFGKNTMLISKRRGSFFFLGALLTDLELAVDAPHETSHCGTCTACLDACPTDAFVEPYVLDARKCISYLTIELKADAPIPNELQPHMEDWLFGCDVCQDVCPWNSKSVRSDEPAFQPQEDSPHGPGLIELDAVLTMNESDFAARFADTPLERTGLAALKRNARVLKDHDRSSE